MGFRSTAVIAAAVAQRNHPCRVRAGQERLWLGKVARSRAYIGVHEVGGRVFVYICDGERARFNTRFTISEWFFGRAARTLDLRSTSGARLRLTLQSRGTSRGEVTLADGRRLTFAVQPACGKAFFLYEFRRGRFQHGLIQLPDGTDRGHVVPAVHPLPVCPMRGRGLRAAVRKCDGRSLLGRQHRPGGHGRRRDALDVEGDTIDVETISADSVARGLVAAGARLTTLPPAM